MKHSDFHIGLEFMGIAGFWWRCTDVGTRIIVAIQLDRDDPHWYSGPPYIAKEVVFDEHEIAACHRTEEEAIRAAVHEHETSGHPGFPHEVVTHMMKVRYKDPDNRYPYKGVLRFDRCRADGEILHPYAGRKDGEEWIVELYLPFLRIYGEMQERDFIALPVATAANIRQRADRQ
ncbi:hypothetical protein ParKJ_41310 [Paraburkholderia fungorum]|jgi:hypothetical protein|uniref:Uncharacterized protein n=1 Tax=Paraburkholderia fungorum TaxID=134537 RepID=A0AAP5V1D6_9BURK|nr:hypothetical protein [Paraburkholderia fungorum]MDT8843837.1 hypothetical protein [Paraburkholderia fungorum]PRZ45646.1 hypothetical protein BX589_13711 [Paraburkholderia fungorum]